MSEQITAYFQGGPLNGEIRAIPHRAEIYEAFEFKPDPDFFNIDDATDVSPDARAERMAVAIKAIRYRKVSSSGEKVLYQLESE